jgi:AcrR family transcriptional regulator
MRRPKLSRRPQHRAPRGPGRPAGRSIRDGVLADREALLDAAERLIGREGPGVTLGAIAAEAGVTKPILYRGVGDRDALVFALAERLIRRMVEQVGQQVAPAGDPEEMLRRLARGYLELAAANRDLYLFVTAGGVGEDRLRQSLLLADGAARQFENAIAAFRADRGADATVATVWAYGLVGSLHYVTLWWLRDASADLDTVTEHITALLWSGFRIDAVPGPTPT